METMERCDNVNKLFNIVFAPNVQFKYLLVHDTKSDGGIRVSVLSSNLRHEDLVKIVRENKVKGYISLLSNVFLLGESDN